MIRVVACGNLRHADDGTGVPVLRVLREGLALRLLCLAPSRAVATILSIRRLARCGAPESDVAVVHGSNHENIEALALSSL
jgi:hypothetical protein